MRIVLTNAGQQEIKYDINDINTINTTKKYKSEQKNYNKISLYHPKYKKYNHINKINHNISHILTEQNYLNDIMKNKNDIKKENSFTKIDYQKQFNIFDNNSNNYKMIKIANKNILPKEIKDLYEQKAELKIGNEEKGKNNKSSPLIKNSFPLKDLLQKKNAKNVDNSLLFKEINENEKHLINYLKSDRTIRPTFMEKINKANNEKLVKLDKICQKYFNNEKQCEFLKQNIKDRIKLEYSNDSKFCRNNLLNMGKNIQSYKRIYSLL